MTFDLFMVLSNLCISCCGSTGRLLHGICKYAGERIVSHAPLVFFFLFCFFCSNCSLYIRYVCLSFLIVYL